MDQLIGRLVFKLSAFHKEEDPVCQGICTYLADHRVLLELADIKGGCLGAGVFIQSTSSELHMYYREEQKLMCVTSTILNTKPSGSLCETEGKWWRMNQVLFYPL
jgi:hypothetical protein